MDKDKEAELAWGSAVGDEVRAWLARKRPTQTRLADHLGLAKSAVTRSDRGNCPFAITELISIARWLDITLESLLGPAKLRARKTPAADFEKQKWALWGSNPRPMD